MFPNKTIANSYNTPLLTIIHLNNHQIVVLKQSTTTYKRKNSKSINDCLLFCDLLFVFLWFANKRSNKLPRKKHNYNLQFKL